VLASPANAAVLDGNPHVHAVRVFDRKRPTAYPSAWRALRRAHYDVVIDCMITAPSLTTLLLMLASGARYRIGVEGRANDASVNVPVRRPPDHSHIVDQLAVLATAFDVDTTRTEWRPELFLTAEEASRAERTWGTRAADRRRRLLVNVSAGTAKRRWPQERFVAAIARARTEDPELRVLVVGSPTERERTIAIARDAGAEVASTPRLRDAMALVATADLLLSPDTSLSHAASAFGTPSVVMLVKGTDTQWGLYRTAGRNLTSEDNTLDSLPVEPVIEALSTLLDSRRGFASPAATVPGIP
jgi:ADP-heptose:LPS heptosyltransferase